MTSMAERPWNNYIGAMDRVAAVQQQNGLAVVIPDVFNYGR